MTDWLTSRSRNNDEPYLAAPGHYPMLFLVRQLPERQGSVHRGRPGAAVAQNRYRHFIPVCLPLVHAFISAAISMLKDFLPFPPPPSFLPSFSSSLFFSVAPFFWFYIPSILHLNGFHGSSSDPCLPHHGMCFLLLSTLGHTWQNSRAAWLCFQSSLNSSAAPLLSSIRYRHPKPHPPPA